jgi:hypothetical protein
VQHGQAAEQDQAARTSSGWIGARIGEEAREVSAEAERARERRAPARRLRAAHAQRARAADRARAQRVQAEHAVEVQLAAATDLEHVPRPGRLHALVAVAGEIERQPSVSRAVHEEQDLAARIGITRASACDEQRGTQCERHESPRPRCAAISRRATRGNHNGPRDARAVARLAREKVRRPKLAFEPTRRDNLRP